MRLRFVIPFAILLVACKPPRVDKGEAAPQADAAAYEDCDSLYYGFGDSPDYGKALACYDRQEDFPMAIVMRLNGEGTVYDAAEVDSLFRAWEGESGSQAPYATGQAVREAMGQRRSDAAARFDYCGGIAGTTPDIEHCQWIEKHLEEKAVWSTLTRWKSGAPPEQVRLMEAIKREFVAFQDSEGFREYWEYIEGTIRGTAAQVQEQTVLANFSAVIESVLVSGVLVPGTAAQLAAADEELNRVYRKDLAEYAAYREELEGERKKQWSDHIREHREYARSAQVHWIRYRDLWAELMTKFPPGSRTGEEAALGIKTKLTKIRVTELCQDPIAPGVPDYCPCYVSGQRQSDACGASDEEN
jgi:uncharacterized protein YecT (DUF1311 family)